jgi:hypothetical protein
LKKDTDENPEKSRRGEIEPGWSFAALRTLSAADAASVDMQACARRSRGTTPRARSDATALIAIAT